MGHETMSSYPVSSIFEHVIFIFIFPNSRFEKDKLILIS